MFCGVCGYNFATRQGGAIVVSAEPEPPAAKPIVSPQERVISALAAPHIEIEVTFDEAIAEMHILTLQLAISGFDLGAGPQMDDAFSAV